MGDIRNETQRDAVPELTTSALPPPPLSKPPAILSLSQKQNKMETPSQPTLSRIALGALDVNKHLNSPLGSPKKSPVKKHNFVFSDDGAERAPVARSLKEQLLETAEVEVLRETPVRVVEVLASPRSEKRKEAPTDVEGREEGSVKVARIEGREMGSLSLGSEVDTVRRDGDLEGDEGLEVCFPILYS